MVDGDGTMTNVEHASLTLLSDPVSRNSPVTEKVQLSVDSQSCAGNGDSKLGNSQGPLEHSTFGVILNTSASYGNDGTPSRRPERVKIIVKRKAVTDESTREGRTISPSKKQKANSSLDKVADGQGLSELNKKIWAGSFGQEVEGLETEFQHEVTQLERSRYSHGLSTPPSLGQALFPFNQNGDEAISIQDQSLHGLGADLQRRIPDKYTPSSHLENVVMPSMSLNLSSSSLSSYRTHFEGELIVSQKEIPNLSGVLKWEMIDADSTGAGHGSRTIEGAQLREDSSVGDGGRVGAHIITGASEPMSPSARISSGGLDHPHTPKARRTPLFFPSVENSTEGFFLSLPCQSANPTATSSPAAPAKRSPLPLPVVRTPLTVAKPLETEDFEDVAADGYEQMLSEDGMDLGFVQDSSSREDSEVEEQIGEESLYGEGEFTGDTEDGLENEDVEAEHPPEYPEDETEAGDELEFEAEASDGLDADLDVEDEGGQEPAANANRLFNEEDLADDDFTAGLKLDISVFDHDPDRSMQAGAFDALNGDDLSYEDFAATLKSDLPVLEDDMQASTNAQVQAGFHETRLVGEGPTQSLQSGTVFQHLTSQGRSLLLPNATLGHPRFSFQSLVNGDLRNEHENDESISQEGDLDSDQLDEKCQDTCETSNSPLSNDIQDGQDGFSSARPDRQEEMHSPEDSSVSPDGIPLSSGFLDKPETSRGLVKFDSPATTTGNNFKLEVKELSTELVVSTRPLFSPSQPSSRVKRLKVKMSSEAPIKKDVLPIRARTMLLKEAPMTAKGLLATGILAGFRVRYLDRFGGVMLTGRINRTGIICDCSKCKGKQEVNVSAFEKHAGSTARHPSDFIHLDNGKTLHQVMEAGWRARENGRKVLEALHTAMGFKPEKTDTKSCSKCETGGAELTCSGAHCSSLYHLECAGLSSLPAGDWQCSQCGSAENIRRPPKSNSSLLRETSTGKDSNANMHKALFVPGGLLDDTEVGYYVKGQRYLAGLKKGPGILCSCCNQVVSCSQFEQHAGWGSRRNPYSSIYLPDGQSLHIAALDLGQKKGAEAPLENIDYCTECGDGGELVLCDSCPGAYHPECAGLVSIPAGNWFCPRCKCQRNTAPLSGRKVTSKIKIKGGSKAGGLGNPKESTDDRCTRLLKATDTVSSGCVFCRSGEFEKLGFGPRTILLCDQCEREYHVGCLKEHGLANLEELPEGEWFCGTDCEYIHSILHLLVANGIEPLVDSVISKVIVRKKQVGNLEEGRHDDTPSFAWQLLHGRRGDPLNGKTLSQAAAIFSESFDPIVDESSGRDLIPLMVHSRNIRDQDFGGMHCVVLKRNDEVVTAALVRIFGRQFAELPLVATKSGSTGQGFCKALILSIERLLGILNVERLVLPAAEGAEGIWVNKFGFSQLPDEESRRFRSEVQMMIFKGSSLLQKSISTLTIK